MTLSKIYDKNEVVKGANKILGGPSISLYCLNSKYRKILKISPGAYIFQRPFSRGLFLEGLIFGGAYLWREICISKSIGLAL